MNRPKTALNAVDFQRVKITGGFWRRRMEVNRRATLPIEYQQCKSTGRIDALRLEWKPDAKPAQEPPHIFWDSDLAKWIEAAAYSLANVPDQKLERQVDAVVDLLAASQQPDGYLNTHYSAVEPDKRWTNLRDCHELYCAGHLIEAAVAYHHATGKRKLLDVLCRYADHIAATFGRDPGQKRGYCGHEEIELALVRLYRATGRQKYLELASYFVDERGRQPHYFDLEAKARGEDPAKFWQKDYSYCQADRPVREQKKVAGHAVRAMYLYAAMADLAREKGDASLHQACRRLWDDLGDKKLYITGGIGPSGHNEGFTSDYDLPNESAYAETCAAVALVFWAHRLVQLDPDSRYSDVMERCLYNGTISGVSLDGKRFFYVNPLESRGKHHRQAWFGCACCPPNIARLIASIGQYLYSTGPRAIYVHLYTSSETTLEVAGQPVRLVQQTGYPWDSRVELRLEAAQPARFALALRIPGWCRGAKLKVNGKAVSLAGIVRKGYALVRRTWRPGDRVVLDLPMAVERIEARPEVRADIGRVALQRGPVVYCLEEADNGAGLNELVLPAQARLEARFVPGLLDGVCVITGRALWRDAGKWGRGLYRPAASKLRPVNFKAVPYYAWDNRAGGEMLVWLRGG